MPKLFIIFVCYINFACLDILIYFKTPGIIRAFSDMLTPKTQ